jgi:dTDP-4-dehydrorhamnose reductase
VRVLVTGAGGMLGGVAVRQLGARGHDVVACDRHVLDITNELQVRTVITRARPDAVLHCAAYTAVDMAESEPDVAHAVNAVGAAHVSDAAAAVGARFVYVSTDYVFDGAQSEPYAADAPTAPLGVYARTKLAGELAALAHDTGIVVRISWVYGKGGKTFGSRLLDNARTGQTIRAIADQRSVPSWVEDVAETLIRLLERNAPAGIYHASNSGGASWYEFAREAVRLARLTADVEPVDLADLPMPAPRPHYSVLDVSATERLIGPIRSWNDALAAAVHDGL